MKKAPAVKDFLTAEAGGYMNWEKLKEYAMWILAIVCFLLSFAQDPCYFIGVFLAACLIGLYEFIFK